MTKTVIRCAGNVALFTLMGLACLFPVSEWTRFENEGSFGLEGTLTIFPVLFLMCLIALPILNHVLNKKYGKTKTGNIDLEELTYMDEREKIIVAESTKVAYRVLTIGLVSVIMAIGGIQSFALFSDMPISMYRVAVALLTLLLDSAMIAYCVKWCFEYKR